MDTRSGPGPDPFVCSLVLTDRVGLNGPGHVIKIQARQNPK